MPHELATAKFKTPPKKKKPSITKRGETDRKVCEKLEKKGLAKWAKNVGTLLEQMQEKDWNKPGNPLARLGTAIEQHAYKVSGRKDLTQKEKTESIQSIIDQITDDAMEVVMMQWKGRKGQQQM